MDLGTFPLNSARIQAPTANPSELPLRRFANGDQYARQLRTTRVIPTMFPGVATEAGALDGEAYEIAVASTVHPEG
jgi:hypothetical protein